jgi:hypothetical protein
MARRYRSNRNDVRGGAPAGAAGYFLLLFLIALIHFVGAIVVLGVLRHI